MSDKYPSKPAFQKDAYQMLNAVCGEFRRRVKQRLLQSTDGCVTTVEVLDAANSICESQWLETFQDNEQSKKAA